ncbi:MAG: 5-formyltetrahydrofolate cyclo-ligase [Candidatus Omnitrophica bacterium]|nr:5-formyltetrahydrofolate cyclo-ligase [Candidatus Omnitrophota bacterium]
MTKKEIRSKILLRLKIQKEAGRKRKSRIIKEQLFRKQIFQKAKKVMFYISFGGEVDTREMIKETQRLGKIVAVPVCKKYGLTLRPAVLKEDTKLKRGPYGTSEPANKKFIQLEDLDLVIVPGVAFDKKGNRLGRGKGYYDYFLKDLPKKIHSIGLAFDFQILPVLPTTTTDVRVDQVISNEATT